MRYSLLSLALLPLGACTLNVQPIDHRLTARTTEAVSLLKTDLRALSLDAVKVRISPTTDDPTVSVRLMGLLAFDRSIEEVTADNVVGFDTADPDATRVRFTGGAIDAEGLYIDALELALHEGTAVELASTSGSIEMRGLHAPATLTASSGSIEVEDATEVQLRATSGSIQVVAESGSLQCDSGSIEMELTGPVRARTTSGSISGSFGGGGELSADSGSLELRLLGPLDRDLVLEADSGSIDLVVPADLAARVEARAGSGSVEVNVGSARSDDGHSFVGDLHGGGAFVIRASTSSGSIRISSERED